MHIAIHGSRSSSGWPAYVFQHAHPSAHATTPWYSCSHIAVRAPREAAALKAAESLRGPDCPSHDLDVAGDNPRYGWSVG